MNNFLVCLGRPENLSLTELVANSVVVLYWKPGGLGGEEGPEQYATWDLTGKWKSLRTGKKTARLHVVNRKLGGSRDFCQQEV